MKSTGYFYGSGASEQEAAKNSNSRADDFLNAKPERKEINRSTSTQDQEVFWKATTILDYEE